jgi:hypothetical protein
MEEDGSLSRFLNGRGMALIGRDSDRDVIRWMNIVGGSEAGLGLPLVVGGLLAGSPVFWSIGVVFVGTALIHFACSVPARRRSARRLADPRLTKEASELLLSLSGWTDTGHRVPVKTLEELLTAPAAETLREAAFQYNRLDAYLTTGSPASAALARLDPAIRAAGDEAIIEILHQAALAGRYPEIARQHETQARERLLELTELANHVERLQLEGGAPPRLSRIQDLLQQLREEQGARAELSQGSTEPAVQEIRRHG